MWSLKIVPSSSRDGDDQRITIVKHSSILKATYNLGQLKVWDDEESMVFYAKLKLMKTKVWKVGLMEEVKVAVKVFKTTDNFSQLKFQNELNCLGNMDHPCMVKLVAQCPRGPENPAFLIFEYAKNGSLGENLLRRRVRTFASRGRLSDLPPPLTWYGRVCVASNVAEGIRYIHDHNFVHGQISSTNIVLGKDLAPLICEFGIACPLGNLNEVVVPDYWNLDDIYSDPQSRVDRTISMSYDTFSFGVVILELISGANPSSVLGNSAIHQRYLGERIDVDDNIVPRENANSTRVRALHNLAKECLAPIRKARPSMEDVAARLRNMVAAMETS